MIRCSELYHYLTHRPYYSTTDYNSSVKVIKEKVENKGMIFSLDEIDTFCKIKGMATDAKLFKKHLDAKINFEKDELPVEIKDKLKTLYLTLNGFNSIKKSKLSEKIALVKGTLCEDEAIKLLNKYLNTNYIKNTTRKTDLFLTGECDIDSEILSTRLDIKISETWETFKSTVELVTLYYWQLVGYEILFGKRLNNKVVYVLMPDPQEIIDRQANLVDDIDKILQNNASIESLPLHTRFKFFDCNITDEDLQYAIKRISKCEEYYNSLNLTDCFI